MRQTKQEILHGIEKDLANSKFVANNTLQIEYTDGSKAIRLHNTDVVTFVNSHIVLNSGGWRTLTTKDRINHFSPVHIYQEKGLWFIGDSLFYDGIETDLQGNVISEIKKADFKEVNRIKREIRKYCNLITKDNLPVPDNGDCWDCSLYESETKKPIGDFNNNTDHLLQHLEEGYLHGSILVNSMREYGFRDEQIGLHYSMKLVDTFKRALRRYLQKRLIKDIATA